MALPKGKMGLAALGAGESMGEEEDMPMDTGSTAAESFLAAVESKDAKAVKSAFRAMYDECAASMSDDYEE